MDLLNIFFIFGRNDFALVLLNDMFRTIESSFLSELKENRTITKALKVQTLSMVYLKAKVRIYVLRKLCACILCLYWNPVSHLQ